MLAVLLSPRERARPLPIRLRLIATLFGRASNVFMVALAAFICGGAAVLRGDSWIAGAIAAAEVTILILRCAVILAFQKHQRLGTLADPDPWLVRFGVLAIGSSVSWGALCFVCLAFSHDPVLYVIPLLSTVGTAGAVAARNSGVPRLAKLQLTASLSPILAGCLLADDAGYRLLLLLVPAMAAGLLILISERHQQLVDLIETQAELARLSQTDGLTQISNRRFLDDRLADATAQSAKRPFTLLMVDVDHFKAFNDCFGHPAGDALLQKIAAILRSQVRSAEDVVARYGGEEFAVLLHDADLAAACAVGERLRQTVQSACPPLPDGTSLTVSIGVASGADDAGRVVRDADDALYRAKRDGRNRVRTFTATSQGPSRAA